MVKYCQIFACQNSKGRVVTQRTSLHEIQGTNASKWVEYIKIQNDDPYFQPLKSTRICSLHFSSRFKDDTNLPVKLSPGAYPGEVQETLTDLDVIRNHQNFKEFVTQKLQLDGWFYDESNSAIFDMKNMVADNYFKIKENLIVEQYKNRKLIAVIKVPTFSKVNNDF